MNKLEFIDYLLASGFDMKYQIADEYILSSPDFEITFFWDRIYIRGSYDKVCTHQLSSWGIWDMPFLKFAMLLHALDVVNFETNLSKLVNKSYV